MKLCITEKPSVGADIARILGATSRHDGYYEGAGYCVTWTFGHLCELKYPDDYSSRWKAWSLGTLPMLPPRFGIRLKNDAGIHRQFKVIEHLIGEADEVINCGDAGQEGELIQRWVMQKAGCAKPVMRLWVSSLTDEAVKEGFKNLRPQKDLEPLYTAGLCRAIGDWILGINATRLYTLKYGRRGEVLSLGRVQTPTLALVVGRQREIENFVPSDTWELRTKYREVIFTATREPFATEQEGQQILESIKGVPLQITSITKKKGREAPPRLFDLTSLQVECDKKFSMSADHTLRTIQSLYEKKLTTYPRVDTTYLPDDVYPKCGAILNALSDYQDLLQNIRGKRLPKSKKVFDGSKVTDHHAIIPTGQPLPAGLSQQELDVYHTVARRFVSVFFPDCEFEQTTVQARVGKENFKATGKVITSQGWKLVYPVQKADGDNVLPAFQKGESGPHEPLLAKRTSQPPKYFTEGTLLKAMETAGRQIEDEDLREALKANGIGRPSTRAAIIETLYKRAYIRKQGKSLRATEAGCQLIDLVKNELLKSAKLTGIWENRLRMIERGEYDAAEFIDKQKQMITQIVNEVLADNTPYIINGDGNKQGKN